MNLRYEIRDTHHPKWKGQRFSTLERARREMTFSVGVPGRWILVDRETKEILETS